MPDKNDTTRACFGCKQSLPATTDHFYVCKSDVSRNNPRGWSCRCIPCYAARQKQWREAKPGRTTVYWRRLRDKDPEAERQRANLKTRKLKARVLLAYSPAGPCCACCGESAFEFLTIDHVGGGGAEHRRKIGATRLYDHLVRENFPPGFRVLCMNCNAAVGMYGYCPHQQTGFDIRSLDLTVKRRAIRSAKREG